MTRIRLYHTEEERVKAEKESAKRGYEKSKNKNRDIYRISSLRTYYRKRLNRLDRETEQYDECADKIEVLTEELKRLRAQKATSGKQ